jgi:GTPase involved in cell partitioning and DNA repair
MSNERLQEILHIVKWNETQVISLDSAKLLVSEIERLQAEKKSNDELINKMEIVMKKSSVKAYKSQQKVERLEKFYNYFSELYGQNLQIANWHQNDTLEPFDDFFDSAEQEMALETEGKE